MNHALAELRQQSKPMDKLIVSNKSMTPQLFYLIVIAHVQAMPLVGQDIDTSAIVSDREKMAVRLIWITGKNQ